MRAADFSPMPGTVAPIIRKSHRLVPVRGSRPAAGADVLTASQPSPLHSFEAFAGAVFVASMAACWIALASTTTAPLIVAGELMTRAVRVLDR